MEYRILGKTALRVSVLSFGASSLGGMFRPVEEKECIRAVHVALDHGINYIDVAPHYGLTRAEIVLGRALKGVPRDRYYLASKVGRYGEGFDFSAAGVKRSVEESLSRLNVDYLDVVQCHDIEFAPLSRTVQETIPALREVVSQGKARFVGITGMPLKIYPAVMDQIEVDTILSYPHYTLFDTSVTQLLPYLRAKNVGIISASPLALGLLTRRGPADWLPAGQRLKSHCAAAVARLVDRGVNVEKIALQFAVGNPQIHTVLVGSANPEHVRRNIEWIREPPDPELLQEAQEAFAAVRNWTWPSGLEENN